MIQKKLSGLDIFIILVYYCTLIVHDTIGKHEDYIIPESYLSIYKREMYVAQRTHINSAYFHRLLNYMQET